MTHSPGSHPIPVPLGHVLLVLVFIVPRRYCRSRAGFVGFAGHRSHGHGLVCCGQCYRIVVSLNSPMVRAASRPPEMVVKRSKKSKVPPLVVSKNHRAHVPDFTATSLQLCRAVNY